MTIFLSNFNYENQLPTYVRRDDVTVEGVESKNDPGAVGFPTASLSYARARREEISYVRD